MSESKTLVFIDQFKGTALSASWEVFGAADELKSALGGDIIAMVFGSDAKSVAEEAFQYSPSAVFYSDDPSLADYRAEPYTQMVVKVAKEQQATVILFPTTSRGRELAAMASIDLDSGVIPDVTALEVADGTVAATRPVYAGKLISKAICQVSPQIITTRVRAFKKPAPDISLKGEHQDKSCRLHTSCRWCELIGRQCHRIRWSWRIQQSLLTTACGFR